MISNIDCRSPMPPLSRHAVFRLILFGAPTSYSVKCQAPLPLPVSTEAIAQYNPYSVQGRPVCRLQRYLMYLISSSTGHFSSIAICYRLLSTGPAVDCQLPGQPPGYPPAHPHSPHSWFCQSLLGLSRVQCPSLRNGIAYNVAPSTIHRLVVWHETPTMHRIDHMLTRLLNDCTHPVSRTNTSVTVAAPTAVDRQLLSLCTKYCNGDHTRIGPVSRSWSWGGNRTQGHHKRDKFVTFVTFVASFLLLLLFLSLSFSSFAFRDTFVPMHWFFFFSPSGLSPTP